VVDIHEKDQIASVGLKFWIVVESHNRFDVGEVFFRDALFQHLDHFGLHIDCIDDARLSNGLAHGQGVITVSCTHVAYLHPGFEPELLSHSKSRLFPIPLVTDQPSGTRPMHRLCDLAAQVLGQRGWSGRFFLGITPY
jgi:hypothetical protein